MDSSLRFTGPITRIICIGSTFGLITLAIAFSWTSRHWLLVGDASLMHYVVFLIEQGWTPYKDIVDVNLPGTYAVEWFAIHIFGGGSAAWRCFDLAICFGIGAAMSWIAWTEDRLAGAAAGALFLLVHGRDGMNELGQRDLVMTLVLLCSTALLVRFRSRRNLSSLVIAGTLAGFAATIKPTAAVFWIAMLVYVCWRAESRREAVTAAATGLSSFLMAPAAAIFYLWRRGGLDSFWGIATELVPLHNRLLRVPDTYFLLHPFASSLLAVCLLWLIVTAIRFRSGTVCWSDAEALLLIGLLCGLFSFYIQRKALPYHRYPANGYLGLLACLGFCKSLKSLSASVSLRVAGATGLLFCTLIVGPQCFLKSLKLFSTPDDFSGLLQNDLEVLGGPVLDHKIQCIDFTAGCVTTLYRMKLQQSTGFLYDCYLFRPEPDAVVHRYRSDFWQNLVAANPEVIVLSNHDCSHPNSFGKIYRWPLFASYLGEQYSLLKEVHPPHPLQWASKAQLPYFYRIYVRNAR